MNRKFRVMRREKEETFPGILLFALLCLSSLFPPAPGAAQSEAAPIVSYREVLERVLEHNADLAAAQETIRQTAILKKRTWTALMPVVTVTGNLQYTSAAAQLDIGPAPVGFEPEETQPGGTSGFFPVDPEKGLPAFDPDPIELQKDIQFGFIASLQWTLLNARVFPLLKVAEHTREQSRAAVAAQTAQVLFAATTAYFGIVGNKDVCAASRSALQNATAHLEAARAKAEAGIVTRLDVVRAEAEVERARSNLDAATANLAAAKEALRALAGDSLPPDYDVAPPPLPELDVTDPEELVLRARRQRPELAAARAELEAAQASIWDARMKYMPTLVFSLNANYSETAGFTGEHLVFTGVLGLSWTLFDGGGRRLDLAQTRSAFLQKELTLRQRLIDTDTEVRRKRIELSSAREQLDHAKKALTLSEEAHRLAEELYAEGVADALSVLDAQTALFNAQIALARAKTGYAYAYLALELALGEFPPEG